MKNFKVLVATSLACVLDVGVVYGGDCNTTSPFACFKYTKGDENKNKDRVSSEWKSYKQSKHHKNIFGSLEDYDGQYIPKSEYDALEIVTSGAMLILGDIRQKLGLKNHFQVGLYIDVANKNGGTKSFKFNSTSGLTVGNIFITKSIQESEKEPSVQNMEFVFTGNNTVNQYGLMGIERYQERDYYLNAVRNIDISLALLGGVWNNSGRRASFDFRSGARMMGDFYAVGKKSEINAVFHEKGVISEVLAIRYPLLTIFEGGIYSSDGGEVKLQIHEGSVNARSWTSNSHGIVAKNNGRNTLIFSGGNYLSFGLSSMFKSKSPQSLFATELVAYSSVSSVDDLNTQNSILFKNNFLHGNLIQIGLVSAQNGKNMINTEKGSRVNLEIEELMVANGNSISENIVMIDGMMTVGRIALRNQNLDGRSNFGLVASDNGVNFIMLQNHSDEKKESKIKTGLKLNIDEKDIQYMENRTLAVSEIYASGSGINQIDVNGDLVLLYRDMKDDVLGGKIVASDGGRNIIEVTGGLLAVGYQKADDILLDQTLNVRKKNDRSVFDGRKTAILVYGNNKDTKNEIMIKNAKNIETKVLFGSIIAHGGTNSVFMYGGRVELENVFAKSWNEVGGQNIGGINDITFYGSPEVIIREITTQQGGRNDIVIYKEGKINTESQIVHFPYIDYSYSGLTLLSFGTMVDGNSSDSGITLELFAPSSRQSVSLDVLNISTKNIKTMSTYYINVALGAFYGNVKYSWLTDMKENEGQSRVNYFVQKDAIFSGSIFSENPHVIDRNTLTSGNLFLGDGAKFILKNSGVVGFDILILSQSAHSNTNVFLDTIKLPGTVLDLATDGGGFSSFKRGNQGKTLDITTMVINANDGRENPPLLRFYAGGTGEGQADNIKVQEFKSGNSLNGDHSVKYKTFGGKNGSTEEKEKEIKNGGTSLQAQVFLPTDLIGHDFTGNHVAVLTVSNGGENLNVTPREAQTGFTTYKVDIVKVEEENKGTSRAKRSSSSSSPSSKSHRWELGKTLDAKISPDSTKHAGNILTHNPSAWVTVLNSLNKRMGELRDNPYNQGVWARVFGGEQTSNHSGVKIDSGYVFLQSGYDYVFSLGSPLSSSLNYLGFAVSYGFTNSKSKEFVGGGIFNVPYAYHAVSHTVEFGLYDVFLHSSGFYSDSVIKVGYITTDFQGINEHSSFAEVSNCYVTLGEELGYQFKFGAKEEWMITPQVEVIYGYLTESHAKQEFQGQMLHSILDGVHTLRTRLGADFTYRYKGKSQVYDFRIGASYEFDYANASATYGIVGATYLDKVKHKSLISTDHRAVINIGINMMIHEQVRLYADLESSYGGKVNTKYQASVGVRYSFGEKSGLSSKEIDVKMPMQVGKEGGRNDYKY